MRFNVIKACALLVLVAVTIGLYLQHRQSNSYAPNFSLESLNPSFSDKAKVALFESEIIPQPTFLPAAHSSSFTMLPNGDLLAFWFAGTKEGNPDVKIWQALYHQGKWQMATPLLDPQMIGRANHRYVIKIGNPVIFRAKSGVLNLFVVSVSIGGWSGSALNHLQSLDNGHSWTLPERIVISPFFNISTLVRAAAVNLSDGGFYLPVYHEFIRKYPELLHFDSAGNFIEQIRISAKNHLLQPNIVPLSGQNAWAYFRNSALINESREMFAAFTANGGKSWGKPQATNLTNPDSSVVAANLGNGQLLMVYNPLDRNHLLLAISHDGLQWTPIYALENNLDKEFSYPSIQINGDIIDILYTNNRQNIKHVRFNRKWLNQEIKHANY